MKVNAFIKCGLTGCDRKHVQANRDEGGNQRIEEHHFREAYVNVTPGL